MFNLFATLSNTWFCGAMLMNSYRNFTEGLGITCIVFQNAVFDLVREKKCFLAGNCYFDNTLLKKY